MRNIRNFFIALALTMGVPMGVQAAGISCVGVGNAVNALSPSDGCEIGSTNNHSEALVNADLMFGTGNWIELGKFDMTGGQSNYSVSNVSLDFTTNFTEGTLTVDWGSFLLDVMVVFKDGAGEPPTYVGHLLSGVTRGDTGVQVYDIQSPFYTTGTTTLKDISNIGFYTRPNTRSNPPNNPPPPGVPIPATGALMALPLLVLLRRRKQKQQ